MTWEQIIAAVFSFLPTAISVAMGAYVLRQKREQTELQKAQTEIEAADYAHTQLRENFEEKKERLVRVEKEFGELQETYKGMAKQLENCVQQNAALSALTTNQAQRLTEHEITSDEMRKQLQLAIAERDKATGEILLREMARLALEKERDIAVAQYNTYKEMFGLVHIHVSEGNKVNEKVKTGNTPLVNSPNVNPGG